MAAIRATRGTMLHMGSQSRRPRPTAGTRRLDALAALVARVSLRFYLLKTSLPHALILQTGAETALPCAEACPQELAAQ